MEFDGRIIRVLPTRSGTSQNGNEWKRLPFVFAYFENADQRWEDKVLLETWDTNIMAQIAQYCEIGQDGKVVVENGNVKLKVLDIKCKCGFSHSVRDVTKKDGSGTVTMNDLRCYRLEIINQAVQQQAYQPAPHQQANHQAANGGAFGAQPFPPQVDQYGNPINQGGANDDDLPF